MCTNNTKFLNNIWLILYFVLSLSITFGNSYKASQEPSNQFLTQHGNLICKGEIESNNMRTTRNGHMYAKTVINYYHKYNIILTYKGPTK